MTFILVPALSFADCNMTGSCPGAPNPQITSDANNDLVGASNMFAEIGAAIMNGVGSAMNGGQATVVPNGQKSQSLTGLDSKGRKIRVGDDDESTDDSTVGH